jgi:putative tryptophan/tyrosine transport system substrate-binding protein
MRCLAKVLLLLAFATTTAHAQTARAPARIGWITYNSAAVNAPYLEVFLKGMNDLGHTEGRSFVLVPRFGDDRPERVEGMARELMAEKPDIIVALGAASMDTIRVVRGIPIIYGFSGDPVAAGWATSLATPHENLTGVTFLSIELNAKRIEMLKQAFPTMQRLAVIANPLHPGEDLEIAECRRAAERLGLSLAYYAARDIEELNAALQKLDTERADAVIALPDVLTLVHRRQIIEFAAERGMPVISGWARFAESGGLLTYGPNLGESFGRLAYYAHRVLNGAKPSSLPIEQPSRFELVVNMKTATRLGIELPQSLLARADQVIE